MADTPDKVAAAQIAHLGWMVFLEEAHSVAEVLADVQLLAELSTDSMVTRSFVYVVGSEGHRDHSSADSGHSLGLEVAALAERLVRRDMNVCCLLAIRSHPLLVLGDCRC